MLSMRAASRVAKRVVLRAEGYARHAVASAALPQASRSLPVQFAQTRTLSAEPEVPAPDDLTEAMFHEVATETLEDLETQLDAVDEFVDDAEINNSQGVLTLQLGAKGTYVLNKQTPNRQIWWSSPVSGPKRFYWHKEAAEWRNTRDDAEMLGTLRSELKGILGEGFSLE